MTRWLFGLGLLAAAMTQNPPTRDAAKVEAPIGTAAISGVVLIGSTGAEAARGARVTLSAPAPRTATTDDAGRFSFRNLPAGRYTVRAYKAAYLTTAYGARWHDDEPVAVPIGDGETRDITMRLTRGAVITGTVRDGRGLWMAGVRVSPLRFGYSALTGERTLLAYGAGTTTDDRGIYRTWGLPAGEYVVAAWPQFVQSAFTASDFEVLSAAEVDRLLASAKTPAARTMTQQPPSAMPSSTSNYAPIFYPGAAELPLAARIRLSAGEERAGVDIPVRLVRTARIHGTVSAPVGVPPQAITIELSQSGPDAEMLSGNAVSPAKTRRVAPDGTFAIADVGPGTYRVMASTGMQSGRGAAPMKAEPMWAMAEVRVDGADVPLALELQPAITVRGRVVFDGGSNPPDASVLRFSLVPPGSGANIGAGPPGGVVSADGRFTFTGVVPNAYRFVFRWNAVGVRTTWTLRSAVVDGTDVLSEPYTVRPDSRDQELVVTFTDRPTELSGLFQDASGRPTTDYVVIVFPADRASRVPGMRRLRTARPAVDGTFLISGLPPGDYLLAALADLEPGIWNDPDFLASVAPAAIPIALAEGERKRQDVRVK